MKKILSAIVLLGSLNAFSVAIEDDSSNPCIDNYSKDAFGCALSTTFSLPVLIIADQEVQLTQAQANMMVLSEIESGETAVTKAIADANGTTVEEVQNAVLETLN